MNQAALPVLPSFLIYVRNLLETRMKVTTYNHHARLLLPSPWSFSSNQCIRAEGADAVMKSVNRPNHVSRPPERGNATCDNAPIETAHGRLPEYQPIQFSMLASDRGAMHASREQNMRPRPPRAAPRPLR